MKPSTLFLISVVMAVAASFAANASAPFAMELFHAIAPDRARKNVVVSPASIGSCLALTYLGAAGDTASELLRGLQLSAAADKQQVAQQFGKLFEKTAAGSGATLRVVNRVYVADNVTLAPKFNALAAHYFHAEAANVDFTQPAAAAAQINAWVGQQTENKIQQLVSADGLDGSTTAVLVNAVYFKAKWSKMFSNSSTLKRDFALCEKRSVQVDMMSQTNHFRYGVLDDLDATAVELDYQDTDITMLVVLPNRVEGLPLLEYFLQNVDLTELSAQLSMQIVRLSLPKFKIEFDISLEQVLRELGMHTMFTKSADFSDLVSDSQNMQVDEVKHKAFIEVSEGGTEAAGATFAGIITRQAFPEHKVFMANHPFFFALKDKENVYFMGHVSNF